MCPRKTIVILWSLIRPTGASTKVLRKFTKATIRLKNDNEEVKSSNVVLSTSASIALDSITAHFRIRFTAKFYHFVRTVEEI